jgi:catechol 2,3-dioxygenase-like lactoylglutathione lyase family enzyme
MFDHVHLRVGEREASERFYDAVLAALGVDDTYRTRALSSWDELAISSADSDHPPTAGIELAFAATSREQVDAFWSAAGTLGAQAPGEGTWGEAACYHAVAADPEGNRVEALHIGGVRTPGRLLERLTVASPDVAAAVRFYGAIAAAAGFHPVDGGATFAGRDGGELAIVGGAAPRGLHIAFPGDEEDVRRFHADALAAGYRDNGAPGARPQYHAGYYSAYVLDPDGTNVEVVDHHRG